MLIEKIISKKPGILLYGLTPPKHDNPPEKLSEISQKQIERIRDMDIDGLVLYDIQDESDRTAQERAYPFIRTVEPWVYSKEYLKELKVPRIIYRCVGKCTESELALWLSSDYLSDRLSVFVGVAADHQEVKLKLNDAYDLVLRSGADVVLGGVLIPERHTMFGNEHLRIANKIKNGCKYFISQATYNVEATKNFLSDYYYHSLHNGIEMVPIIINLTPCGSVKTMDFMKWLGLSIPKWLENELVNSVDILDKSMNMIRKIFEELLDFGLEKGIPIGCSVESISTRKVEIDASVQLTKDIRQIFERRFNI